MTTREIDGMQRLMYQDALIFANAMRLPENADLLAAFQGHKPEHDILRDMYYDEERRAEWKRMFGEDMPANAIEADQAARLKKIEQAADSVEHGGHSGASWGYMMAVAKCALNVPQYRSGNYMNWIIDLEYTQRGSCILSADEEAQVVAALGETEFTVDNEDPFRNLPSYEELKIDVDANNQRLADLRNDPHSVNQYYN